jgi:WD40 repeat protein
MANDSTASFPFKPGVEEVLADYLEAVRAGCAPRRAVLLARHPDLAAELTDFFAADDLVRDLAEPLRLDAAAVRTPSLADETIEVAPSALPQRFGDYEQLELIATSGMGFVYRARQVSLDRIVALKMVPPGGRKPADLERFLHTEARAVAGLDHPHIVPIYDFGTCDGQPFFSMKLLEGGSLAERLRVGPQMGQREAVQIMATVARAVHHAHQRGILHRDLKPANILLDAGGAPHVADFGLAKRVEDGGASEGGNIVGTPRYMAPEQAAATPVLTTAADVYALGAVLFEMLTGRPLREASSMMDMLVQARTQDPRPLRALDPRIDADLEAICLKCLDREPQQRYGSAEALADDLECWLRGEPVAARRAQAWEQLAKWAKRRPAVAVLLGVAAALLLVLLGALAWGWQQLADKANAQTAARVAAEEKAVAQEKARAAAQGEAEAEKRRADEAAQRERTVQAHLALEKGTNRIERGEIVPGLLWLAHGLDVAPDDAGDLRRSLRTLLGGWTRDIPSLKAVGWHDAMVNTIVFSPDGKMILTSSNDKTARRWDAVTGKPLGEPLLHPGPVDWAVIAPDGASVVTAHRDYGVHLWRWDARTGKQLDKIISFRAVHFVVLSPDCKKAAVGLQFHGEGSETQLWDITTRKMLMHTERSMTAPDRAAFSPDGTKLLVGRRTAADLIDVSTAERIAELPLQHDGIATMTGLTFSPNSKVAVTANNIGWFRLWDAATGKPITAPCKHANERPFIGSVVFRPDGKALLTTSSPDGTGRLWDLKGSPIEGDPLQHVGTILTAAFSPDGKVILTGGTGGTVRLWDTATHTLIGVPLAHRSPVTAAAFSPDGTTLITGSAKGPCHLWEMQRRSDRHVGEGRVQAVALSPDGKTVVAACDGAAPDVRVAGAQRLDVATGKPQGKPLRHGSHGVSCLTFSADGKLLATGSLRDRSARVWDAATGRPRGEPCRLPEESEITSLAFSADGKFLLTLSGDDTNRRVVLRRWDPAEGNCPSAKTLTVKGLEKWKAWLALGFSPRGTYCAVIYYNELPPGPATLALFDAATGDLVHQRTEQPGQRAFAEFAFSPDEKRFLTVTKGARDESRGGRCWAEARLWDVATGRPVSEPVRRLQSQGINLKAGRAMFSPDGRTFVTNDVDGLQFWDTATMKPVGAPLLSHGWFEAIALDAEGKWLAVPAANGNGVRLIPAPPVLTVDPERLRLRIEVVTGMELDAGASVELDAKAWRERWERLQKIDGMP